MPQARGDRTRLERGANRHLSFPRAAGRATIRVGRRPTEDSVKPGGQHARPRGRATPSLLLGGVLIALLAAAALVGPWAWSHRADEQALACAYGGPSPGHPLGLDDLGRDVLARVLAGARVSLGLSTTVVVVSALVGAAWGLVAGFRGGWIDEAGMRLADVLVAFPGLLLAMAVVAVRGPSVTTLVAALCLTGWVGHARLVRAQVLRVRELDHVTAARALGASDLRLMLRHVLPACVPALLVQASLAMGGLVVAEAGLSFLGLGVGTSTPSWGQMLSTGTMTLTLAPHLAVFPGLAIALAVLGFNLLGDGLRDWLDPRQA